MGILGIEGIDEEEPLGSGAFAFVYRAWQSALQRHVAVKVLAHALDDRALNRFARECATVGSLSAEPGILPVYAAGRTAFGSPYLIMPLMPGGSLADRQARGPMDPADVVGHGIAVGSALVAAHERRILHLDVKPANILLDARGHPRLADFGIARFIDAEQGSRPATMAGTPGYAAPEIFDGRPATVRSDVYGLGATLHALACGRPPFSWSGSPAGLGAFLRQIEAERPPDLRPAGVPEELCLVLERAMAKAPSDRYASMDQLVHALGSVSSTAWRPGAQPTATPMPAPSTPITIAAPGGSSGPTVPLGAPGPTTTAAPGTSSSPTVALGAPRPTTLASPATPPPTARVAPGTDPLTADGPSTAPSRIEPRTFGGPDDRQLRRRTLAPPVGRPGPGGSEPAPFETHDARRADPGFRRRPVMDRDQGEVPPEEPPPGPVRRPTDRRHLLEEADERARARARRFDLPNEPLLSPSPSPALAPSADRGGHVSGGEAEGRASNAVGITAAAVALAAIFLTAVAVLFAQAGDGRISAPGPASEAASVEGWTLLEGWLGEVVSVNEQLVAAVATEHPTICSEFISRAAQRFGTLPETTPALPALLATAAASQPDVVGAAWSELVDALMHHLRGCAVGDLTTEEDETLRQRIQAARVQLAAALPRPAEPDTAAS